MDINSLTPQELQTELKKVRKDWTPVYLQLNEQGNVVFDKMPDGLQSAIYNHYRFAKKRPHVQTLPDGRVIVYFDNP